MARRHEPKFKVDAKSPDASFRLRLLEWFFIRFSFPICRWTLTGIGRRSFHISASIDCVLMVPLVWNKSMSGEHHLVGFLGSDPSDVWPCGRYLDVYERIHFLGEEVDRRESELHEEDDARNRRKALRLLHTTPTSYNTGQHLIPGNRAVLIWQSLSVAWLLWRVPQLPSTLLHPISVRVASSCGRSITRRHLTLIFDSCSPHDTTCR